MVGSMPGEAATGARPGVAPQTPWACPASHPIKGYLSESGRRVYYVPEHPFYEEASPERCYASEEEAQRDGSRPVRGNPPRLPFRDLVRRPERPQTPARRSTRPMFCGSGFSEPDSTSWTSATIASDTGVATPRSRPQAATWPFMKSISVRRRFVTS